MHAVPVRLLPHRFPFELIDPASPSLATDTVTVRLTGTAGVHRGARYPASLGLEILAQAALSVLSHEGGLGSPGRGMLAGLDGVSIAEEAIERPLMGGDVLEATVRKSGGFGRLLKVYGVLRRDGSRVVEAHMILTINSEPS